MRQSVCMSRVGRVGAVGRHLDVANKTIRRVLDSQTVALRSRDRVVAVGWRRDAAGLSAECAPTRV